jgi:putative oxidoreductase
MKFLTETNTRLVDTAILLLRCMVGLIFFVAGAGKVFGLFGGMGLKTTIEIFKTNMNIAAPWAYLSCYTELIGGFLLIIGLFTRPAAFALVINMLVATVLVGPDKFFMGGGAYPCSLMVSSLVILLTGPMAYSVDAWLFNRNKMQLVKAAI